MNTNEIATTLKNKGFEVKEYADFVSVKLSRPVSFMEVEYALDFEIEREHMFRTDSNEVNVIGLN